MAMLKAGVVGDDEEEESEDENESGLEIDIGIELRAIADSMRKDGDKVTMPKLKEVSGYEMSVVREHWKDVKE